jgi:hypothetical protein
LSVCPRCINLSIRILDLIIVADTEAFDFPQKYRDKLFPGTPVVFCGVNYFQEAQLQCGVCVDVCAEDVCFDSEVGREDSNCDLS